MNILYYTFFEHIIEIEYNSISVFESRVRVQWNIDQRFKAIKNFVELFERIDDSGLKINIENIIAKITYHYYIEILQDFIFDSKEKAINYIRERHIKDVIV